jgi:hypothetical protein
MFQANKNLPVFALLLDFDSCSGTAPCRESATRWVNLAGEGRVFRGEVDAYRGRQCRCYGRPE